MKKDWKKLLCLILAAALSFTLVACGDDDDGESKKDKKAKQEQTDTGAKEQPESSGKKEQPESSGKKEQTESPARKEEQTSSELEEFVKSQGNELVAAFTDSFEKSSGMNCRASVKAVGNSIVLDCLVDGWDNIPQDVKDQMQEAYDSMKDVLKAGFGDVKTELPSLSAMIFNICEQDGDIVATINLSF